MGLTRMILVALAIAAVAFVITLPLRTLRVTPGDLAMGRSLTRINTTTTLATAAGLGVALWAWFTFPTIHVNATEVPGLLAALGPTLSGLVFLSVTAAAEATWRRPTGAQRAAHLTRRPLFSRALPWATRALWAWGGLLAAALVTFGVIAEPDGRSLAHAPGTGGCLIDGVPVPCDGGASGPFPGFAYGVPMLAGAALLLAATLAVLHLVARRPAVWGTSTADDDLLRTISATRVVRGSQLALGASLAGVLFFAGTTAFNAGWWWAWAAIVGAVAILGAAFAVALRRVGP